MSADNGIYILKTAAQKGGGYEYRVTHAQAIENIYYDVSSGEQWEHFIPEIAFQYFGEGQVFTDEQEALGYAHKKAEEYAVLEYGVCVLDHPEEFFRTFATEQLEFFEAEAEKVMERHRQERNAARDAKLSAAKFVIGGGETFIPTAIYGYMNLDGKQVHGALYGVEEVRINNIKDGAYFLPNDWSE